jgi:hypothetical protein
VPKNYHKNHILIALFSVAAVTNKITADMIIKYALTLLSRAEGEMVDEMVQ